MDTEPPDFRATIRRNGTVRLVDWGPWLASGGPLNTLLDARGRAGVCIADLTVVRDDDGIAAELVVHVRCGDTSVHRDALLAWAAAVGYRRVWFDADVVDLPPAAGGRAEARCTGCGVRLVDEDADFWAFVRTRGAFPAACVLCGSDVPQWKPTCQKTRDGDDSPVNPDRRSPSCR